MTSNQFPDAIVEHSVVLIGWMTVKLDCGGEGGGGLWECFYTYTLI